MPGAARSKPRIRTRSIVRPKTWLSQAEVLKVVKEQYRSSRNDTTVSVGQLAASEAFEAMLLFYVKKRPEQLSERTLNSAIDELRLSLLNLEVAMDQSKKGSA